MKDTRRTQVTPNIVIRPSFWTLNTFAIAGCESFSYLICLWSPLMSNYITAFSWTAWCFAIACIFLLVFLRLHALQFPVLFLLLFFCLPYPGLRNCESVFLILKIWQYCGSRQWVQHFQGITVRFDIRIEISIFIRPMITKIGKQIHVHD